MKLTKELLQKNYVCKDAIVWCERNKLFGFPLDRLGEIIGDFNHYVSWLRDRTFNEQGLVIRVIHSGGADWRYEYEYYDNGQLKRVNDMFIPLFG